MNSSRDEFSTLTDCRLLQVRDSFAVEVFIYQVAVLRGFNHPTIYSFKFSVLSHWLTLTTYRESHVIVFPES